MNKMVMNPKFIFSVITAIIIVIGCICAPLIGLVVYGSTVEYQYENTDIARYGEYPEPDSFFFGLYDRWSQKPVALINDFFPGGISENFSEIQYRVYAENVDAYGFEAYLEFTIEDRTEFEAYIRNVIGDNPTHPFRYDNRFQEYKIADIFSLDDTEITDEGKQHYIGWADIRKILYSEEEQRIIYVALGMYDGGGDSVEELSVFFPRFRIDPIDYEQHAEPIASNSDAIPTN